MRKTITIAFALHLLLFSVSGCVRQSPFPKREIEVITVEQQTLCYQGKPTPRARTLLNVVTLFFAGEVQPRAAVLEQRRYQLLQPVAGLEQLLQAALPAPYLDWQQRRDEQLSSAAAAPRRHALALRQLLDSCGLAPGSGSPDAAQP